MKSCLSLSNAIPYVTSRPANSMDSISLQPRGQTWLQWTALPSITQHSPDPSHLTLNSLHLIVNLCLGSDVVLPLSTLFTWSMFGDLACLVDLDVTCLVIYVFALCWPCSVWPCWAKYQYRLAYLKWVTSSQISPSYMCQRRKRVRVLDVEVPCLQRYTI